MAGQPSAGTQPRARPATAIHTGYGGSRLWHLLLITVAITGVSIAALAITLLGPEPAGLRPWPHDGG